MMNFKDYVGKRPEWVVWVIVFVLSTSLNRFAIMPANASCFITGALTGLGLVLLIVSVLPQAAYDNLLYRKWLNRKSQIMS